MGIGNTLRLARLLLSPAGTNASAVYELLGPEHSLCEKSLFLNLGYWDEGLLDYDRACERLAEELGTLAGLGHGIEHLDVGYGFGDQDFYWAERFAPKRTVGLNVTATQVERARARAKERGLDGRVDLRKGSATAMPLEDASFDVVTSLESAFHYVTREDFFREAFRVLRPGGVLATADILPREGIPWGLKERLGDRFARSFWQIPAENQYPVSTYVEKLKAAGFANVKTRSIRDQVYPPFARYARARLEEPAVAARMDAWIRRIFQAAVKDDSAFDSVDYWLVRAEKPS